MLARDFQEITIVGVNLEVVTCLEHIVRGSPGRKLSNTCKDIQQLVCD